MNKQFRFAIMAGAAVALLAQVPAPSWAQKSDVLEQEARAVQERLRFVRRMEAWLKAAEEARLRGACQSVASYHEQFQALSLSPGSSDAEFVADFQRRMLEIALRDCPSGSGKPSIALPPAQPAPQSTPAPPTAVPVAPAPVGSAGTPAPQDPPQGAGDDILDEIGTDTDRTSTGLPPTPIGPQPEPRRTAPPVPPRPAEEVHVVPRPVPIPPPVPPRKPERTPVPPPPLADLPPYVAPPLAEVILGEAQNAAGRCDAAALETAIWQLRQLLSDAERVFLNASDAVEHSREGAKVHELRRILERALQLRAQCSPPGVSSVTLDPVSERLLAVHNRERAAVGVPPLKWVPALEASATAHAGKMAQAGQLVHAPREGRGIERENLLSAPIGWSPDQMMNVWLKEKSDFRPGIFPNVCSGDWSKCAHYSQMIWPTTTDLGCGSAQGGGFNWVVCRYSPGGNKDGKPVGNMQSRVPTEQDTKVQQPELPKGEVIKPDPAKLEHPM